jgi:hypothetical protein
LLVLPVQVIAVNRRRLDVLQAPAQAQLIEGINATRLQQLTDNSVWRVEAAFNDNDASSLVCKRHRNAAPSNSSANDKDIACGGHAG